MRIDYCTWVEMLAAAAEFAEGRKHQPSVARYVIHLHRQEMKRWKRRKKGPTDERKNRHKY